MIYHFQTPFGTPSAYNYLTLFPFLYSLFHFSFSFSQTKFFVYIHLKQEEMNFEDIVDMDWLNSHTTDSLPSPPTTLVEDEDMMLYSNDNSNNEFGYADMNNIVTPSTTPVMPTTEQIKQLIELAKRQLALREQQQQQQAAMNHVVISEPTPEPDSPPPATITLKELFPAPQPSLLNTTTTTVSPESLIKTEETPMIDMDCTPPTAPTDTLAGRRESFASISDEGPMSLEAYAESDGIDIKKLNSKERRQLRNKISARNFRVRRKEYITTLEGQVDDHKKANEQLMLKLNTVEEENTQLKIQIENLKRQNQSLLSSNEGSNYKDISILGSNLSDAYRQDTSILVEC
ncbi:unnamed protein product [Mucor hiemalis]